MTHHYDTRTHSLYGRGELRELERTREDTDGMVYRHLPSSPIPPVFSLSLSLFLSLFLCLCLSFSLSRARARARNSAIECMLTCAIPMTHNNNKGKVDAGDYLQW